MKKALGFTLTEIMVTLAIISILAAIAYPTYTNQIRKLRRSDAKIALVELAGIQEDYYVKKNNYAGSFATLLNIADGEERNGFKRQGTKLVSKEGHYLISFPNSDDDLSRTFTLKVVPIANGLQSADTHCNWFQITATGKKTATNDDCW